MYTRHNKEERQGGVSQVLNKRGGSFNDEDEKRLAALLPKFQWGENAKLFDDVQNQKNYSESILSSMHDTVITIDENKSIKTCNPAGLKVFKSPILAEILNQPISELLGVGNEWLSNKLESVSEQEEFLDATLEIQGEKLSVNLSLTLLSVKKVTTLVS